MNSWEEQEWHSHSGKQFGSFLVKSTSKIHIVGSLPTMGIYSKESKNYVHIKIYLQQKIIHSRKNLERTQVVFKRQTNCGKPIQWNFLVVLLLSQVQLFDPTYCSPPDSSVHGISQARILEWVAMSSSKESSWPRDRTFVYCFAEGFFTIEPPGKPYDAISFSKKKRNKLDEPTWINLKGITPNERSQFQNVIAYMIPCIWHSEKKAKL